MASDEIVNVWDDNLETEFDKIMGLIDRYKFISMDTEFPGICVTGDNMTGYSFIKNNVDKLRLIQVGITLANEQGDMPSPVNTWQFNFKFDLENDDHAKESINLLKEAGIDFEQLNSRGIHDLRFAELLYSTGLILNEEMNWITFHGAFDFGYLLRSITNKDLPSSVDRFYKSLKEFFPTVYDLKILVNEVPEIKNGSLTKLGNDLEVKRSGIQHQAGSDAYLTSQCFFKIKKSYFKSGIPKKTYNRIYGLLQEYSQQAYSPSTPATSSIAGYQPFAEKQPPSSSTQASHAYPPGSVLYHPSTYAAYYPAIATVDPQTYYFNQFDPSNLNLFSQNPQNILAMQGTYKVTK